MEALLNRAVPLLLEWYRFHKRILPWREENPRLYRVLVSEIMLQQTRVEAVKEYYLRFLEKFPTAQSLAGASEEEVLKAWEGLGYYNRARCLQRAAQKIADSGVPKTYEAVRALPGVGDYTAGAICSIALGLPCPAVDGNVLRILTRLFADGSNVDDKATRDRFTKLLEGAYPKETGDFCQALMELGAIVGVPNGAPLCGICPWKEICRAHLAGREADFPVRKEKKARRRVNATVCVLEREGKYALEKRASKGLLAGLWQFPFFEDTPPYLGEEIASKNAVHIFTHVEWHMKGKLIRASEFFPQYVWASAEEIETSYALPSAFKAFFGWLK